MCIKTNWIIDKNAEEKKDDRSGICSRAKRLLIAALIRASVGAAVVAMTMAAEIMAAMPGVAELSPVYLAAMVCAINGGAPANVALAASRLGAHTAFIGKAGNYVLCSKTSEE